MDIHPWTKYDIARARDEERLLRAMATYRSLRGSDGGALDPGVASGRGRLQRLDRVLRRGIGRQAPAARGEV